MSDSFNKSRRKFFTLGFLHRVENNQTQDEESPEMVKMLSQDGKLVEIPKRILDHLPDKKYVTAAELMKWTGNKETV